MSMRPMCMSVSNRGEGRGGGSGLLSCSPCFVFFSCFLLFVQPWTIQPLTNVLFFILCAPTCVCLLQCKGVSLNSQSPFFPSPFCHPRTKKKKKMLSSHAPCSFMRAHLFLSSFFFLPAAPALISEVRIPPNPTNQPPN